MKHLIISTAILFSSYISFAQKDTVYIVHEKDEMTEKSYNLVNRPLICISNAEKKGFKLMPMLNSSGSPKIRTVYAKAINIGSCSENDLLIILLDNGDKIHAKSWKEFNCENESYFDLSSGDLRLLSEHNITKIRLQNGRSFDSYTHDIEDSNKDYFVKLSKAIENFKNK